MNRLIIAAALSTLAALSTAALAANKPVPCEKMLTDVKAAIKDTKVGDADKAKAMDLERQGLERCKADDDAGADAFFAEALKILGK